MMPLCAYECAHRWFLWSIWDAINLHLLLSCDLRCSPLDTHTHTNQFLVMPRVLESKLHWRSSNMSQRWYINIVFAYSAAFPFRIYCSQSACVPFAVETTSLYRNPNKEFNVWNYLDSKIQQIFSPMSHKEQH